MNSDCRCQLEFQGLEEHGFLEDILVHLESNCCLMVIIMPVCYVRTFGAPIELLTTIENWFGKSQSPLLYITAILVFLAPDLLGIGMLFFPACRRKIEQNDHVVIKSLLWWAQVRQFIWMNFLFLCHLMKIP